MKASALRSRRVAADGHNRNAGVDGLVNPGLKHRVPGEHRNASGFSGNRLVKSSGLGIGVDLRRTNILRLDTQRITSPFPPVLEGIEVFQIAHGRNEDVELVRLRRCHSRGRGGGRLGSRRLEQRGRAQAASMATASIKPKTCTILCFILLS